MLAAEQKKAVLDRIPLERADVFDGKLDLVICSGEVNCRNFCVEYFLSIKNFDLILFNFKGLVRRNQELTNSNR